MTLPQPAPARPRRDPPLATRLRMTILRAGRRLRAESAGALSEGHLSVLSILFVAGALTASELAEREHVRPPSMTRTVQYLESEGFIVRTEDPADRRSILIELSEAGAEYIRETRRRRDQWLQRRLAALTREERRTLSEAEKILQKVVNA